jgi:hypothetical protein
VCFQVQFGSNAAAAEAFKQTCSSITRLAAAWPELQHMLLGTQAEKTSSSNSNVIRSHHMCDTDVLDDTKIRSSIEQEQQQQQQQQQQQCLLLADLYDVSAELQDLHAPAAAKDAKLQPKQNHQDAYLKAIGDADARSESAAGTSAAAVKTAPALELLPHAQADAQSAGGDGAESDALQQLAPVQTTAAAGQLVMRHGSADADEAAVGVESDALVAVLPHPTASPTAAQLALKPPAEDALAAAGATSDALVTVLPHPTSPTAAAQLALGHPPKDALAAVRDDAESDALVVVLPHPTASPTAAQLALKPAADALAAVRDDAESEALVVVLPLPYAHYSLVRGDGRPLERPDKHPFALSRVVYDARWVCRGCCCCHKLLGAKMRCDGYVGICGDMEGLHKGPSRRGQSARRPRTVLSLFSLREPQGALRRRKTTKAL